ncbi:uncharacterized protein LOC123549162 [Mercenaria mercenaria]|uniref:uncharacterized protein LOC123549162 n=1 Tax=Mercenaria mercenaria TaxID=6596 RepID=UPI00234EE4C3|nr:uncharacterized protein LOC123549162 [Mercenaria mercenaria]XP_053401655.1 uncharacterized protein LOC123549162 [Mercenaria mercenaria]
MARYRKNETAEQSSDEEELFSYLKKVHTVKQATQETKEASPDAYTEKSRASNPDDICQVSQTSENTTDVVLDNTDVTSEKGMQNSDKSTDKTFDDSETNLIDVEQHIAAQSGENKHTNNTDENSIVKLANSEHNFEQQIEINSCTESKADVNNLGNFTDSSSIEVVEEQKTEFIKTKNSSLLKGKDTKADDGIVSKPNPESSRESDKYYLINEKDWLSLCAKLSSTDKQTNFKEQHEASKTDALRAGNCDKQDVSSASSTKTKPLSVKGKSMFSAFKQYNPFTKTTLRKADLEQKPRLSSPHKVNVTTETKKLNINSEGQTKSPFGNELNKSNNESKTSEDPKTTASPKVEIVYIRLEDGQIKYDINKSPLATTASIEETNLQAVKKLDFSEHKQELAFENRTQGDQSRATHNLQNSSQENYNWYNFPNAIEENYEQSNPNTSFTRADNTHYDTGFKPGMQVRFVRINNKLTRVYENVERNVVDEVLYSDDEHNKSDHQEHSSFEHCDNDQDDSFNFDDSQLVAFPLNAVDPEMIIKDDSLAQLTPSKLEFLNTSGKHDPLTPNKSEFLTPSKQDPLTPNELEMFTPSKLELLTPSKLDILSTSEVDIISDDTDIKKFDEYLSSPDQNTATAANQADVLNAHFETESPIVLKVTKSGGLVQCKSTESSPERNVHKQQNSITTNENKAQSQKSHIQNLWKTFKPVQRKSKANIKQSPSIKKSEDAGYEHIENYNDRSEQSSDEDDLTNYFSMTNHASKNSANTKQSVDLSKEKSEIPSSSVSIQASFPDSSDDSSEKEGNLKQIKQKVRKRKFCEVEDRKKINYKTVKTKNAIAEAELKVQSAGKKKKGNRQIMHFYKDFNYKQVEFKDFELEQAQKSKATNMDKRKVDFHIEGNTALEKHPDNEKLKEHDEVQSTVKVKEVGVRKARVNGNKKVKQIKDTLKEQGKSKGNKKSCLKTGLDQKESKMIKNSVEENETFHIEGNTALEKHPDNEKLKELDKVQSTVKVKEIKVRKTRVNGNKEVKQIKDTLKEQGKSKGNKKSCLKTGLDQKESKMIKNSVEENETFHIEGNTALEKRPDNEKFKELDKVQSTVKVKVRKTRVNGNKEVKQIKDTLKEQGKSKGNKKSCLKTGLDQKESKMIKNSVEENETGMKPECKADDNTDTYSNDESQKKIEFLEKLFQIKLKEAATDTTNKKRSKPEPSSMKTLHEENNGSVTGRKLKNRRKSSGANTVRGKGNKVLELPVAEESVENGKQVNVTNENIPGVKKGKRRKDEIFDSVVSIVNKEQDLNTCQSDKTAAGSRIKYKCSEKIGKGRHRDGQNTPKVNVNLEMDTLDVRKSGSNERIQKVDRASPAEVKKPKGRKRKQNITLGDQIKGSKNKAQVLQTICKCDCYKIKQAGAGSKSKNRGKIAKRKSKVSANADELKTEKLNRQMDEPSLPENVVEMEFTKLKKPRGRSKITKIAKEEKIEAKSLTNSVSGQQGFVDNIEIRPGDAGEKSKKKPSAQTAKNIRKKRLSEKTKIRNTKRKKSSLNTVSSTGKSDSVQNGEFPCAIVKGNTQLVDGAIEGQLDNTIKHIEPSERSVFVNCDEKLSSSIEDLSSHDGIVSILATFQPLQEASSQKLEQKTKISKRKKKESDKQNVGKSKKMKQQAEADDTFLKETEEEPVLTHEGNMSYLKLKQFKQESISYLDEDESEMSLDLSLQQTEAQEVKGSSSSEDIDKNAKRTSLKRSRDGKVLEKSMSKKVASPKKLKSTRKPCSSRKIKTVTKRQEKESWKDMLDDGAFKLDCNEKMNEKHKPVNVRHMIKDILKSVKGAEKISDRHVKHKERKDGSHKHCKSNVGNTKQRVTSESDDAWLSDSGPGVSFPAFKFTGMSDSEENRESIKSQTVDNGFEISTSANSSESELDRSENDRVTEISDSKLFKQTSGRTENNYMELHHSPLKVSSSLGTNSASSENSHLTSLETKELVENSKGSPEMKKNVDKLRALLDKVSDKRVVKNLQFADTVSLSDTEH